MNQQYLEYVRGAVSLALADIHGMTKGQLAAFEGAALAHTSRFKRQRHRTVVVGNRKVCPDTDPIHCPETRTRAKPFPPIEELTYCTSSWRRAISVLETHQEAWIRYCYGDYSYHHNQLLVVPYIWAQFSAQCPRKISKKVKLRMQSLTLLAVQVVASEIKGHPKEYSHTKLAELSGVSKSTWTETYSGHWNTLLSLVETLDAGSLKWTADKRIESRSKHLAS
ncbi:bacteriophage antitermination protein Q [Serratia fonticola]|uniref:bacteriophage antitermination protein Q n=1 Tax=Serratia fonticola TaxID=47917 RepID=UPI003AAD08CE